MHGQEVMRPSAISASRRDLRMSQSIEARPRRSSSAREPIPTNKKASSSGPNSTAYTVTRADGARVREATLERCFRDAEQVASIGGRSAVEDGRRVYREAVQR